MPFIEPRAVVTGGGSGLGRAFCEVLAERKGRIVIGDVNLRGAEETAERVERAGGQARVVLTDVRDPDQVERLATTADEWFGDADLLINNAGVAVGGRVGEVSLEDWKWQVDINLWGVVHGCHHFVPRMRKKRRGAIINVASAAGLISPPQLGPYNVTKAGVISLSETLHAELKSEGIRVTVLCPTFFLTNIVDSARGLQDEALKKQAKGLMKRSKLQAPDVAKAGLRAVEDGHLYAVPMSDGRVLWRIKRAIPGGFYDLLARVQHNPRLRQLLG